MSFPCTQCGQCCKHIGKLKALEQFHLGDGRCIYYEESVGCKIYSTRPDVCRIDEGYTLFFSDVISHQEFYQKNAEICNQLQIENGIDKQFRVEL